MKKQSKVIGMLAGAAVLIVVAGYALFSMPMPKQENWIYVEEEVKKGILTVAVTERGSLDYLTSSVEYDLVWNGIESEDGMYLEIEEICVSVGQRIAEGDALVQFTQDSVDELRLLLENAVAAAKESYLVAEREYDSSVLDVKMNYDSAKIAQKYATDIYDETGSAVDDDITSMDKEIDRREDMTAFFEEKVETAQKKYDDAKKAYQTAKKSLSSAGTRNVPNYLVLSKEYQDAKTAYYNAESEWKQAKENLENNEALILELEEKLADAKARLALDKLDVKAVFDENTAMGENAQVAYDAAMVDLEKALADEDAKVKEAEDLLAAFDAFVGAEGILYAREAGIITEVIAEEGDRLTEEAVLMNYTAPQNMYIEVAVAQEEVVKLHTGDAVTVRFDAYQDTLYNGTIQEIRGNAITGEAEAASYQVVVNVKEETVPLYKGMTADVTFVTEKKENVLYVSERAIVEADGRTYVYMQTVSGGYMLKEIEIGMYGDMGVEILSGLQEGEVVYIAMKQEDVVSGSVSGNDMIPAFNQMEGEESIAGTVSGGNALGASVSGGDGLDANVSSGDVAKGSKMPGGEERP